LRKRLPTANELVYDNYNFFVIGYCSTERPSDCILSIAAGANGVGLSFYHGATLADPHRLLLGSGSQNRFLRIESAQTLLRPEVEDLIAAAIEQAQRPLPEKGRGRLIIRSISKKQRPRRKDGDKHDSLATLSELFGHTAAVAIAGGSERLQSLFIRARRRLLLCSAGGGSSFSSRLIC
jgi:hypothetical protein